MFEIVLPSVDGVLDHRREWVRRSWPHVELKEIFWKVNSLTVYQYSPGQEGDRRFLHLPIKVFLPGMLRLFMSHVRLTIYVTLHGYKQLSIYAWRKANLKPPSYLLPTHPPPYMLSVPREIRMEINSYLEPLSALRLSRVHPALARDYLATLRGYKREAVREIEKTASSRAKYRLDSNGDLLVRNRSRLIRLYDVSYAVCICEDLWFTKRGEYDPSGNYKFTRVVTGDYMPRGPPAQFSTFVRRKAYSIRRERQKLNPSA